MAIFPVTAVLFCFAMASVFYIGYLIGRVQKLGYCDHMQLLQSKTNSVSLNYVTEPVVPEVVRCPPDSSSVLNNDANTPSNNQRVASMASIKCDFSPVTPVYLNKRTGMTQDLLFSYVNHAAQPTKGDIIITHRKLTLPYKGDGSLTGKDNDPFTQCREVYLTRTGSRPSPKAKCGKFNKNLVQCGTVPGALFCAILICDAAWCHTASITLPATYLFLSLFSIQLTPHLCICCVVL